MARGYPEPKESAIPPAPTLLPPGTCMICKRRPAAAPSEVCLDCAAKLAGVKKD